MDDLNARSKRRNFLYKLVRPWKWRRRKSSKIKSQGELLLNHYRVVCSYLQLVPLLVCNFWERTSTVEKLQPPRELAS